MTQLYQITTPTQGLTMFVTVKNGVVTEATSPERPCLSPNFIGEPWSDVRTRFEAQAFRIARMDQ